MPQPAHEFEVAVVGAGPGGTSCAAFCAIAGLRTVILERASFPREKVCGDCVNPLAWPVLARLGVTDRLRTCPHAELSAVEFIGCNEERVVIELPRSSYGEITIKRSALDSILLERAVQVGAHVLEQTTVTGVEPQGGGWLLETSRGTVACRYLVAADGRNSTVARLLALQPPARKDRCALQTHIRIPSDMPGRVRMQFVPEGYTGLADIGDGEANLCLVARPENLERLRSWAIDRYQLPPEQTWRTITPLSRSPIPPLGNNLLLVGDAARVVEPFTGEGISYALRSGEHAASALISGDLRSYTRAHTQLYRGRLWLNQGAKLACLRPDLASAFLRVARLCPPLLGLLTRKVIRPSQIVQDCAAPGSGAATADAE